MPFFALNVSCKLVGVFCIGRASVERRRRVIINQLSQATPETATSAWRRGLGIPNLLAVIAEDLAIFDCKLGQAVLIEPGLPPQSPENGNIPAYGRRLSGISTSNARNWESGD